MTLQQDSSEAGAAGERQGARNFARDHQARYIAGIAAKLRDMAEEVERADRPQRDGTPYPPGAVAGRVSHTIAWGFANLNLESLITNIDDVYAVDALNAEEAQP